MSADLAFINANVHTMNPSQPTAQAIAVTKNKIVKVGTDKEIKQLISEKTRVIPLDGKTVVPGLIDTHIHVADFGRCLMWLDLTGAKSISDLQSILKEKARQMPVGKWIIGQGWNENRLKRLPTAADLDAAAPNNPVVLYREAAMICVANTKALKAAGATEQAQVPFGGKIDKDPQTGKLTGIFRDTAVNLIWQAVPEPTIDDLLDATVLALQKIVAAGITSIHWLVLAEVELEIIQRLNDDHKLIVRVNVVVPQSLMKKAQKLRSADTLKLHVGGVTINVDGYLDSKEAALNEPYSDEPTNSGKLLCREKELASSVKHILTADLQPVILAMGDRAIETTLNVIEQNPRGKVRFRIEQAAVLNKNLLQRLGKQNLVVSIQPKMISTEFTVWSAKERLGKERARWLHPLKALVDAGVKVAGGSDCPMEPLNPLLGMQEAAARKVYPEQRLTVEEAMRMYTLDAAYSGGEEKDKGSIEEGKLADLTVLASDPTVTDPDSIQDIGVCTVVVDGKIIWQ